jgi:hypothetical protein
VNLNFFTKTLLRLFPGPLESGGEVFHVQLDPYERMVRFVGNHILAKELTEEALLESFKQGRVFISFDSQASVLIILTTRGKAGNEGTQLQFLMIKKMPDATG